jgi:uncharacterized protein (TIGR02001 family)
MAQEEEEDEGLAEAEMSVEAEEPIDQASVDAEVAPGFAVFAGSELEFTFPSDGATQELSGYIEAERNGIYGGVLALVANDSASNEIELYAGYRAETDTGFGYDISYTRYFYPNDGGDCCGEITLWLGQSVSDRVDLSTEIIFDPEASLGSISVEGAYNVSDRVSLSANFGVFEVESEPNEREWDVGVSYDLSDEAAVDLRYYDGSDLDGYLGLSLTFDTTLLGG